MRTLRPSSGHRGATTQGDALALAGGDWRGVPDAADRCAAAPSPCNEADARVAPFENGIDRIDWISPSSTLTAMNDLGCRTLATTVAAWLGKPWHELWSADSRETITVHLALARANGATRFTASSDIGGRRSWWDVVLSVTAGGLLAQARDTSTANAIIDQYRHRSSHDELTGLLNRVAFKEALGREVDQNAAHQRSGAVLMLDLDNFKMINDTMGHDIGDLALQTVADRIREVVGDIGCAARLGGDEFAIVLSHVVDLDHLRTIIEQLLERLAGPVDARERTFSPRASVGVALFPKHGTTPAALLKHADVALYAAKSFGRGGYVVFVPSMSGPIRRRASAAAALRSALAENRIDAFYQPIIDLASNRLLGFEAKLQVVLPDGGVLPETDIASVNGDVDLAEAMGARILGKVADDARRWRDCGLTLARVAINAGAAEFRCGDYARRFLARIDLAGLPHDLFELEVAETVFAGRGTDYVAAALRTLNEAGVRISLDEFGSGPASLSHLKRLPIGGIKIDRSFVEAVEHDPGDGAIVRAMIGLASGFGIGLAADGIATNGQAAALKTFGCRVGQGPFFGNPEPADAVAARLDKFSSRL